MSGSVIEQGIGGFPASPALFGNLLAYFSEKRVNYLLTSDCSGLWGLK